MYEKSVGAKEEDSDPEKLQPFILPEREERSSEGRGGGAVCTRRGYHVSTATLDGLQQFHLKRSNYSDVISAISAGIAYVGSCNLLIGFCFLSKLKRAETPSDARTPEEPHFKVHIQMSRPSELVHPSQSTMILTTRLLASRGKSVSRVWIYVGSDSF